MSADLLVEIGTEELPPKALDALMTTFGASLAAACDSARLDHGDVHAYASPRRLAVLVEDLAMSQADRRVTQKGPPVSVAFDDDGNPKPAATAFAEKCGVGVDELDRQKTDKGEWLCYEVVEKGEPAALLLPGLVEEALGTLPIPRRMRWGEGDIEFVRPVHWIVLLHGDAVVDGEILGLAAGRETRGHRFHADGPIEIRRPADYLSTLEETGYVVADARKRKAMIEEGVRKLAAEAGGEIVEGERLYDEVTALVEWPVPLIGRFDEAFLELPREVVVSTLTGHQRYFPVADADGALLPAFITVANLESREPERVRDGNERVIRPRLADAAFFWRQDRQTPLAARIDALADVVYQQGLGSLRDKAERTAALAVSLADDLDTGGDDVERAARLAKCDLVTGMVGEFPELQGTMGRYYAAADGESEAVSRAIGEQYLPRHAGDDLPETGAGRILAIADRLDTLAGIFTLGKRPSGNRDPFGLRRAALGIVRILVECELDVDLKKLVEQAATLQPDGEAAAAGVADEVFAFINDRLRRYFLDRDAGLATETFDAVLARAPVSPVDFGNRLAAVQAFLGHDAAESLAAANKRIANILRKADIDRPGEPRPELFEEDAEQALHHALTETAKNVRPMIAARAYTEALEALAELRAPVDRYFDEVMVMTDDDKVRNNRLALLGELRALFLGVADISRLGIG